MASAAGPVGEIFLSYKSDDRARVRPLVDALTAEGLTLWWDVAIEGGAVWREVIQERLDAAACVVVVWSELSVGPAGRFVHDEAARADRRGVYLPVGIDAVEPPLGFGQRQVLPLTGWRGSRRDPRFVDLVAAIRAMISGSPAPLPRAPPLAAARPRPRWPWIAAGGTALAAVLGFAVVAPGVVCTTTGLACRVAAPPNSIAVLPFANLSADPDQQYFSDGLSEELLSALASLDSLQVAARTSSFKFKGSSDNSRVIGEKLGVAYVLDGSVRRSGDRVRVNAQLVDAGSGFERWSQTYDRDLKDVFAVQRGVAEAVAAALKVKLLGTDIAALRRAGTASAAANDAYLHGRAALDAGAGESATRAALAAFETAITADPRFAEAHAARARALLALANQFVTDPDEQRTMYDVALASARQATKLAPDLAESQSSLAGVLLYGRRDIAGARAAYRLALKAGSGKADILLRYGLFASRTGDLAAGLAAVQQAVVLDPLNPRAFKTLALSLLVARRYPEAIAAAKRAIALSSTITGVHSTIGDALLLQGRLPEAAREYTLEPQMSERLRGQAIVLARQGNARAADAALTALVADSGDSGAYQQAQVLAQRGQAALAIAALDRAFKADDPGVLLMTSDPLMDPLRSLPAFAALAARLDRPKPA